MKCFDKWPPVIVITSLLLVITHTYGFVFAHPATLTQPEDYFIIFEEEFEGSFPPAGWSVIDYGGSGRVWTRNDTAGVPNYCEYGSGFAAVAQPGETNSVYWNTELRTPPIDLTDSVAVKLEYASHFQDYSGNGEIRLDISTDNGISWETLRYQTEDDPPGTEPAVGGTLETESLAPYSGQIIILRWRFSASARPAWMWHIDSIKLTAVSENGLLSGKVDKPLQENFESQVPPSGWEVIDTAGSGGIWGRNDAAHEYNFCEYGSGFAAGAHAGEDNTLEWDTELRSPAIDLTDAFWAHVSYASYFQEFSGNGQLWLDISTDSGQSWTTLRHQTEDDPPGGSPMPGGTLEPQDLSPFVGNIVQLRWRYQADSGPAWLWQIDDVDFTSFIPLPRLEESALSAPRFLAPGDPVSFNYIIHLKESTDVSGFDWDWAISINNSLPEGVIYGSGSLWCSQGVCQEDNNAINWEKQLANEADAFLVYNVDVPTPRCGSLITNTAVLIEPNMEAPLNLTAVTGIWEEIWLDEPLNSFPPTGWTVSDYGGSLRPGSVFTETDPGRRGNRTGGRGDFVIVDNATAGDGIPVETDLRLPSVDIPAFLKSYLVFKSDFVQESGAARAQVQISLDDGGTWETLLIWEADQPGPRNTIIDLSPYAGVTGAQIRFFYDDNGSDVGWWALDDIQITGCPGLIYFPLIAQEN